MTSLSARWPLCNCCRVLAGDSCPHNLVGFVGAQGDTEAGTAEAGTPDETIGKYEQEKRGVAAVYATQWVLIAHNNTPNAHRPVHFAFQAEGTSTRSGS